MTTSVWRYGPFQRLWLGDGISELGTAVTEIALPTLAVLQLHAGPAQLGLLLALRRLPFPVLSLLVGVWIDRVPRRRVMVAADALRAVTLAAIPAAALAGVLGLPVLYAVSLLIGVLTVFFDLAALAYVPSLVGRDRIGAANAGMQVNSSIAQLAGPGIGGLLIQAIGAARAIAADSVSYLVSVASLVSIRNVSESLPARPAQGAGVITELRDGISFVFGHPVLRPLIIVMGLIITAGHLEAPNLFPYAYQHLVLSPSTLGWILSAGGGAAVLGALVSRPVNHRLGTGWSLTVTGVVSGLAWLPLLFTPRDLAVPVLIGIFIAMGFANPINNLAQWSQRQAVTPDRLQGRMSSVFRTVYWGIWPLSELGGGYAGSIFGPLPVIVGSGVMVALFSCLALVTPLRRARI